MSSVSIIIPVYNRVTFLPESIGSALQQTHAVSEIVVVDDGSSIDVARAVSGYGRQVTFVRRENGGPAAARNSGIKQATGEWLLFLDDDDFLEPAAVETLLAGAEKEGAQWACGLFQFVNEHRKQIPMKARTPFESGKVYRQMIANNLMGAPSTVLVKRDAAIAVGGFDEDRLLQLCEDYDLWMALAREYPLAAVPALVTNYRVYQGQATVNWSKHYKAWLKLLEKHEGLSSPEFAEDFARARGSLLREFGDVCFVRGQHREARERWRAAGRDLGAIDRIGLAPRYMKSYLPAGVASTLRKTRAAMAG